MDIAHFAKLSLSISIPLMVAALGMRATFADAATLFRTSFRPPHHLLRAVLAMNIGVPMVAVVLAKLAALPDAIKLAMLAMAVSPIPPLLPGKQLKFGGREGFVLGLLVAISMAAIVLVPVGVDVIGRLFDREAGVGAGRVAQLVGTTILLPLFIGLSLHRVAPEFAARAAPWMSRVGNALLLAGLVPTLIGVWPTMLSLVGDGSVVAIAVLVVAAIGIGHALGGPDRDDRTTLAIASAMRHPGVALSIVALNAQDEPRASAAVLLFLLVAALATSVYGKLRAPRPAQPVSSD